MKKILLMKLDVNIAIKFMEMIQINLLMLKKLKIIK